MNSGNPRGNPEAQPFVRVEFNYQISKNGTVSHHTADCCTLTKVFGLKEDLASVFGSASQQIWNYKERDLDDNLPLMAYGIETLESKKDAIRIYVRLKLE